MQTSETCVAYESPGRRLPVCPIILPASHSSMLVLGMLLANKHNADTCWTLPFCDCRASHAVPSFMQGK